MSGAKYLRDGKSRTGLVGRQGAHRRPVLSQHPRQAELRKDTAIGEPHNRGDLVALKGQHN